MIQKTAVEKIFEKPHYKSIINLLIKFQKKRFLGDTGLRQIQFRYVLEKGYRNLDDIRIQCSIERLKRFFRNDLEKMIEKKQIYRECITSKYNLTKFLNNLRYPPYNAIEKTGSKSNARYTLRKNFFNEIQRIQNKNAFDIFPNSKIWDISDKKQRVNHILYGLSEDQCSNRKKDIKKCVQNIENEIEKIRGIKQELFLDRLHKSIERFISKSDSIKIKEFLKENRYRLWATIQDVLYANNNCTKSVFYRGLGWIFGEPDFTEEYQPATTIIFSEHGTDLKNFIHGTPRELSEDEVMEYCKAWSENAFNKDFDFSISDIQEMIEWGWKNRYLYYEFYPLSIAFSRYEEYEEYSLE